MNDPSFREEVIASAATLGLTVPDTEWEMKSTQRGRPRKTKTAVVDTTGTEDECDPVQKQKKKSSRKSNPSPKSELDGSDSSDGEALVLAAPSNSSILARRGNTSPTTPAPTTPAPTTPVLPSLSSISPILCETDSSISPIVEKPKATPKRKSVKKSPEEKAEEKAAKVALKEAEKAAKLLAKKATKEAEKAAKLVAKKATKEAENAAKLVEKDEENATNEAVVASNVDAKDSDKDKKNTPVLSARANCVVVGKDGKRCLIPKIDGNERCEKHTYEGETEDEDSEDEDSEDDAAGVEEFEHGGKKYLRDPSTNDLFDFEVFAETQEAEEVGVYNPETDEVELNE